MHLHGQDSHQTTELSHTKAGAGASEQCVFMKTVNSMGLRREAAQYTPYTALKRSCLTYLGGKRPELDVSRVLNEAWVTVFPLSGHI